MHTKSHVAKDPTWDKPRKTPNQGSLFFWCPQRGYYILWHFITVLTIAQPLIVAQLIKEPTTSELQHWRVWVFHFSFPIIHKQPMMVVNLKPLLSQVRLNLIEKMWQTLRNTSNFTFLVFLLLFFDLLVKSCYIWY